MNVNTPLFGCSDSRPRASICFYRIDKQLTFRQEFLFLSLFPLKQQKVVVSCAAVLRKVGKLEP